MRFHPLVASDAEDALSWYEERSEDVADRLRSAIRNSLKDIKSHPLRFAIAFDNVRRVIVPGFPYIIFYRGEESEIEILGVFHAASNPKKWRRRAR